MVNEIMKKLFLMFSLLNGLLVAVSAQVSVELIMDQDHFLQSESLLVGVRIINQSGQPLKLGDDNEWLRFDIETRTGKSIEPMAMPNILEPFTIESSQMATRVVDLAPCFNLIGVGRYEVAATLKIKQWNQYLRSAPLDFEIVKGTKYWEQDFGVPPTDPNSTQPPEVRKYILQQTVFLNQIRLYVRITDSSGVRVVKVTPLSPMVSFSKPDAQLDRKSNLHVICQSGAKTFTYTVVSPDGEVLIRQSHNISATKPMMSKDNKGSISILGGARILSPDDIPLTSRFGTNSATLFNTNTSGTNIVVGTNQVITPVASTNAPALQNSPTNVPPPAKKSKAAMRASKS